MEKEQKVQPEFKEQIDSFKDKSLSLEDLLEAGVHFGHHKSRWNPGMKEYIYTTRQGIHIIDLIQTKDSLTEAIGLMKEVVKKGGEILFAGTKRQAKGIVEEAANYCKMPFVTQRWLGGTLTNFEVIRKRVERLLALEDLYEKGELKKYTKKEQAEFKEKIEKFNEKMGGIKHLKKLPDLVFVVDPHHDKLSVKEAKKMSIPVVALVDTNANPQKIDMPIPANDDAVKSLKLILAYIAFNLKEALEKKSVE